VTARRWLLALYGAAVLFVTLQKGLHHPGNFLLFRGAFERLVGGENLYATAPDYFGYLYTPTFALLFAPFALLPPLFGLLLWNAANAFTLAGAVTRLLPPRAAAVALAVAFLDVVRSLQNSQSNALMAGLIVLAFLAAERGRPAAAALAIAAGAFTKVYPIAAACFAAPLPRRGRAALALGAALLVFAALPLLVTSPALLAQQYRWWAAETTRDAALHGTSVMGILATWLRVSWPNWPVQVAGTLTLLAPLALRRARWPEPGFRLLYLSSLLIYVVIFNHQAESASYVLATTGIGVWFATAPRERWRDMLVAATLLLVSVAATSLVPSHVRHDILRGYALQAAPCFACWLAIQRELWSRPAPQS